VALAVAQGAHPKAIQRRMGHSTINMTLDRYGHLFPELDQRVANDVGATLQNAASSIAAETVKNIRQHVVGMMSLVAARCRSSWVQGQLNHPGKRPQ
jgi:hypothetical protein